ncbi:MAG: hypothetical protein JNM66_27420 [Bryobacterales bacterium]|nr:hypothetical protein [Bryobacterales bacterium]
MRIRLRVPNEGTQNDGNEGNKRRPDSGGLAAWFQRLFSPTASAAPPSKPALDHRWRAANGIHYHFIGRRCRYRDGKWQSEYCFDVLAGAELRNFRAVLAEPLVAAWESRHGHRMTEESRLRLATQTLESLTAQRQLPASAPVSAIAVDGVAVNPS